MKELKTSSSAPDLAVLRTHGLNGGGSYGGKTWPPLQKAKVENDDTYGGPSFFQLSHGAVQVLIWLVLFSYLWLPALDHHQQDPFVLSW